MDEDRLEDHVAFEVQAWTDGLDETLGAQAQTVLEWLDGVSLGSVFSDADLDAVIDALPVPDLTDSLVAGLAAASADGTPLGDLFRYEDYERVAAALAGMTGLQDAQSPACPVPPP